MKGNTMAKTLIDNPEKREEILAYIRKGWDVLTRSNARLAIAAIDEKYQRPGKRPLIYISSEEDIGAVLNMLGSVMGPDERALIEFKQLPGNDIEVSEHGLLYLPHPYVVPGGRFNEMYGWDSYFIVVGLLRAGRVELAKNMVDNMIYEVRHYGKVLNANRTYYLTRSQPPFLTRMALLVFEKTKDVSWLQHNVCEAAEMYYDYWQSALHFIPGCGLSRYFDSGKGPAAEVVTSEKDEAGQDHYKRIADALSKLPADSFRDIDQYYNRNNHSLTGEGYNADRAMRESGFDPSNRFGPFNLEVLEYAPVCLNTLLYIMETDMMRICRAQNRGNEVMVWQARANNRKEAINRLMWDDKAGLYSDYNYVSGKRRHYPFLTTFYPLWAGIASPEQARRVVQSLPLFDRDGGLQTSMEVTGNQWDAPFGWAPLHMIAVWGLMRYGFKGEAKRVARKFYEMVLRNFQGSGHIVEKYDVAAASEDVEEKIKFGYSDNAVGFGWTNAAIVEFDALLFH
jgi:alpha,alpha-trehalase